MRTGPIGYPERLLGLKFYCWVSEARWQLVLRPREERFFCNRLSDLIGPKRYINSQDISKLFVSFFIFVALRPLLVYSVYTN